MFRSTVNRVMWGEGTTIKAMVLAVILALLIVGLLAPEARAVPSTFVVNSTADTGDATPDGKCDSCTLREAIQEANANNNSAEQDHIDFDIPGTGVHTIAPSPDPLPFIVEPVIINGYSQTGASVNTLEKGTNAELLIQLNGANLSAANEFGLVFMTPNSVVRGLVINRFGDGGILLSTSSSNDSVKGNFIGTNPNGTQGPVDLGNGDDGVATASTAGGNNTIGGDTPAARNLISANQLRGVEINSDENAVVGNLIGTDKSGTSPIGNSSDGVWINSVSTDNIVGGGPSGLANTIAFNGANGVTIDSGVSNSILSNSIFSNNLLGIDLLGDGPTPNDPEDPDTGPNNFQNKPNLTSAVNSSGTTTIKGRLNSTPNQTFTIEFFSNPAGTDEGKIFLGTKEVKTGPDGLFRFQKKVSPAVSKGRTITATATNTTTHDTSEFSAPRTVTSG